MFEHWNVASIFAAIVLALMVIAEVARYFREKYLIKKGVLLTVNRTTEKDIARLKSNGYSVWAIKRYRQLNKGVSLKQAKKYVESLQTRIKRIRLE